MRIPIASLALAAVLLAGLAVTGCSPDGSTDSADTGSSSAVKPTEAAAPVPDLTGTWKQSNSNSADSYQAATIKGNVISIDWVTDGGDTKSIYWIGTFTAPTDANTPYMWTSKRNKAKTDNALLASTDDTKVLTFKNDEISYSASILGTTATIRLKKH